MFSFSYRAFFKRTTFVTYCLFLPLFFSLLHTFVYISVHSLSLSILLFRPLSEHPPLHITHTHYAIRANGRIVFCCFVLSSIFFYVISYKHADSECVQYGPAIDDYLLYMQRIHTLNVVSLLRKDCVKLSRKLTRLSGNLSASCQFHLFHSVSLSLAERQQCLVHCFINER